MGSSSPSQPAWIPKKLVHIASQLKAGRRVRRITVRSLLAMFNAERRGLHKLEEIRAALDSLGLKTAPDFESIWIDAHIRFRLKGHDDLATQDGESTDGTEPAADDDSVATEEEELEAEEPTSQQVDSSAPQQTIVASTEGVVETPLSEQPDPTFRIGSLDAANRPLVTVSQDDSVTKAVTRMLQFDYSQLPIMHGEREVKGMISWRSIASRYALGGECSKVKHCREDAQVIDGNGTLFDALPTIVKNGYVLVRSPQDRRITGIVTASDLNLQFQQLAEPFLLIREIELHVRQLMDGKVTEEDLASLTVAEPSMPQPKSMADLTFGGYIRLLQRPDLWERLALNIDQSCLTAQLDEVRLIRNDVMHFDPDPLSGRQLDLLKGTAKFMQSLYELLP